MNRQLTQEEKEFLDTLTPTLPPVIARKDVNRFLGGMIAPKTLANADTYGDGPEIAYKIGRTVVYRTDSLLLWIILKLGVTKMAQVKNF